MADTLVDAVEPVPPTQREPEPAPPAVEPPKRSPMRGLVAAAITMFVLGGVTSVILWAMVFRYEPTAIAHVPAGSNVVVRFEGADIVLFAPVRNHLLSLVLEDKPKEPAINKVPLAERIHDHTGVRIPVDIREVLVATMDGKSFVALLGGKISHGQFVSGMAEVASEEHWPGFQLDHEVLVGPNVAIGQADDGTIIVGSDKAIVMNAMPVSEEGARLGLPDQGAVRFVVTKQVWENLAGMGKLVPEATAFGEVRRGTGSFTLGSSPELVLRLEPASSAVAPKIEQATTGFLANLRLLTLLAPDRFGEKTALQQAVVKREGDQIVLRAPWPYEGLDRGAAEIAAQLRGDGGLSGTPGAPAK